MPSPDELADALWEEWTDHKPFDPSSMFQNMRAAFDVGFQSAYQMAAKQALLDAAEAMDVDIDFYPVIEGHVMRKDAADAFQDEIVVWIKNRARQIGDTSANT